MRVKWLAWYTFLVVPLLVPVLVMAQPLPPFPPGFPLELPAEPRGFLEVLNDWQEDVKVSVWSHHRERIGVWMIRQGDTAFFEDGGERIKVRPNYKLTVGDAWGWVDIGHVGQFQNGTWYVNIRDVWRVTHRERPRVPDWK